MPVINAVLAIGLDKGLIAGWVGGGFDLGYPAQIKLPPLSTQSKCPTPLCKRGARQIRILLGACLDVNAAGEAPHLQTLSFKHGEGKVRALMP